MVDIILGADGTGPDSDDTYAKDFVDSHVRRFTLKTGGFHSGYYWRGPKLAGSETEGIARAVAAKADAVYRVLRKQYLDNPDKSSGKPRIFLTGYSRGGAAVIEAAYRLADAGLPVHCMMLFDAVDRSSVDDRVDWIPGNVRYCWHAMRADSSESREIFGNCGTQARQSTFFATRKFHCTHGAMGGTPWKTAGDDGTIEEVGAGTAAKVATFAAGGILGLYALHKVDKTKVTLKQEAEGSSAVLKWMTDFYLLAKGAK